MLVVLDAANGRGIGTNLVTTCLAHAKRRGYTIVVAEMSGGVSQHIFRRLGFTEHFTTLYKDFHFNEDAVLSSIVGVEGTILMDREI